MQKPNSPLHAEFIYMKIVNQLAVLVSLGAFMSVAAVAATREQTYIESYRKDSTIPVPVAVVTPAVGAEFAGTTVNVEFTVDATGRPVDLSVEPAADATLAEAVV